MDEQIFEARIRLLLRQWPIIWGGNLSVQAITAAVLWQHHSPALILLWCGLNVALFAWRLEMRRRFPENRPDQQRAVRRWARQYSWSGLVGGLTWGAAAWLFFDPQQLQTTLFLFIVMIGISAGALPALSSYAPAYFAFAGGVLVPLAARLWILEWDHSASLALLTLLFLVVNLFYSRNLERTIAHSITADLTNQALLDEVSSARDVAEQANRAKSGFLAAASHDLRQPLHAMGLFIESLTPHLKRPKQHHLLNQIRIAHNALDEMFDALLEISRLETGSIKPTPTHFHLRPLIDDLVASMAEQAQRKGLSITISQCDTVVHTDSVLLGSILRNLLHNAIKYSEQGEIAIDGRQQNGAICLSIRDNGPGIPADKHELVFSEYQQLANPERDREKGLGLGLAIVKRTAALLRLPLTLTSAPGAGSTFSVQIPLGEAAQVAAVATDLLSCNLEGVHIVLIDDDAAIRRGTRELLTQWGCSVTASESAQQALADLGGRERPPDLLLCDYRLRHGLTGVDAISTIRKAIDPELPALLISGDTDPLLRQQLAAAGYYLLNKPIKPIQLKNVMFELLLTRQRYR